MTLETLKEAKRLEENINKISIEESKLMKLYKKNNEEGLSEKDKEWLFNTCMLNSKYVKNDLSKQLENL